MIRPAPDGSLRFDSESFDAPDVVRLDSGALRIPATLTRTGVFEYRQPDGSIRKEYRPPEEVHAARVLDAIRGTPLTNDHPAARRVDAETYKDLAVGHVGDDVRVHEDGSRVAASVYVSDAATIAQVERGKLGEISLGYRVDFDPTPGTAPDGTPYHGIQRNLRINHTALVPRGRAGRDVGLRLDSAGDQVPAGERMKIKIGGKEYEAGSVEAQGAIDALVAQASALSERLDAAEKTAAKGRAREKRTAILAAVKGRKLDLTIREDADENAVMLEALKKIVPDVAVDGMSPDYIAGAFAVALSILMRDAAAGAGAAAKPPAAPGAEPVEDAGDETDPEPVGGTKGADEVRRDRADREEREDADTDGLSIAERAHRAMVERGASRRKEV